MSFGDQFLTILTSEPWSLAYHAVLAFSILWALQASISYWRNTGYPQGRRMVIGLSMLFAARLILFVVTGLTWQNLLSPNILPAFDCFINLLSLIIIVWLWAFPESSRLVDAAGVLLVLLTFTVSALGLAWWSGVGKDTAFYDTVLGFGSDIYGLVLIIFGSVAMLIRRPNGWGYGLSMMILFASGYIVDLFFMNPGSDYSGAVRLTQMAAYPLLTILPQRFQTAAGAMGGAGSTGLEQAPRSKVDPRFLQTLLSLSSDASREARYNDLTRIVAQLMAADICLLVSQADGQEQLVVESGYNLNKEESITRFILPGRLTPTLNTALRRGKPLRLPASSTSSDLLSIGQALGFERAGPLLAVPVTLQDGEPLFGIVLLSPYSAHGWTADDQAYLVSSGVWLARILQQTGEGTIPRVEGQQASAVIESIQANLERLELENQALRAQLGSIHQQSLQEQARAESLAALIAAQEILPEKPSTQALPQVEEAGLQGSEEVTGEALAVVGATVAGAALSQPGEKADVEYPAGAVISGEQAEVIASMAQDLRQPMSSIVGYTDLLLGESVGILGALQRKFLERVKASTERMGGLIDDIIQMSTLGNSAIMLSPETVDLNALIDEAIALTITQVREKNIALRVDIPDHMPSMTADRDAMQQILIHLLQNAEAATPADGEISLSASVHEGTKEEKSKEDYLLLTVSDTGGGIPSDDLPRVFSRLYRADSALIQGVGDTGVGLAIVKALVEAHRGRIWVDTEVGKGSTFSILLPLASCGEDAKGLGGPPA